MRNSDHPIASERTRGLLPLFARGLNKRPVPLFPPWRRTRGLSLYSPSHLYSLFELSLFREWSRGGFLR